MKNYDPDDHQKKSFLLKGKSIKQKNTLWLIHNVNFLPECFTVLLNHNSHDS